MTDLRLRRDDADRKRYVLEGVGELRFGRWYRRGATVSDTAGHSWELKTSGLKQSAEAVGETGGQAASYEPKGVFKRGGRIEVADGSGFDLKPSSAWRNRYALWSGEDEVASVETTGWSGQEVAVSVAEGASVDALPLLMACWLVRRFGEDDAAVTAGGSAAVAGS